MEWKTIEDYPKYEVSNNGDVRNIKTGKVLKHTLTKGYHYVEITNKDNERKRVRVHRLVANAFIPNPYNLETVNHKDLNKGNNNVENLEWMTYADNNRHSMEKQGRRITEAFLNSFKINQRKGQEAMSKKVGVIENGEIVRVFSSIRQAEKTLHTTRRYMVRMNKWVIL